MVKRFVVCVVLGTFSLNGMNYSEAQSFNEQASPIIDVKVKLLLIDRAFLSQDHPELIHADYRHMSLLELQHCRERLQEEFGGLAGSLSSEQLEMVKYLANQRV